MAGRRLDAEERALWRKVTATVRPLDLRRKDAVDPAGERDAKPTPAPVSPRAKARALPPPPAARDKPVIPAANPDTLDGGWDRRLRRGIVAPDRTIDLHGHTLASAHAALDAALASAVAADARVLLVVTGRAPRPGAPGRGLIRAAIGDWLGASGWASRIAAVRNAHPRHGGAGALYVVLRRRR
ncbi:DNA-nicking endonuclease, Smr domain [Sphingomonas laterariae]|uniref:DNA-nicking endonuclease, Smr domain n=1 Tax=Edaphosphingomonas laterariae TaxID=861865 RepID=A0A239ERM7_9SPHN|nr:Smr/MutS family protein [Sphingomonas laterariae]SNS46514.1 DNA-nicking endonuclease, Smr domain [Sphingomonas laterariae]